MDVRLEADVAAVLVPALPDPAPTAAVLLPLLRKDGPVPLPTPPPAPRAPPVAAAVAVPLVDLVVALVAAAAPLRVVAALTLAATVAGLASITSLASDPPAPPIPSRLLEALDEDEAILDMIALVIALFGVPSSPALADVPEGRRGDKDVPGGGLKPKRLTNPVVPLLLLLLLAAAGLFDMPIVEGEAARPPPPFPPPPARGECGCVGEGSPPLSAAVRGGR